MPGPVPAKRSRGAHVSHALGTSVDMEQTEQRSLFVIMIGACIDAARLGDVSIRLELEDGTAVEGVPSAPAAADFSSRELDHTGVKPVLAVAGTLVPAERVRSFSATRPG